MPSPHLAVPRHLVAIDGIIAAALLALGELAQLTGPSALPLAAQIGLTALYTAPLAVRRFAPIAVPLCTVVCVALLGVLDQISSGQPTIPLAIALAGFTLGRHGRPPAGGIAAAACLAALWMAMLLTHAGATDLAFAFLIYASPYGFGVALRARARHATEQAERRVAEERALIARELHDIVAHSLSVVSLQTQAVRRGLAETHVDEARTLEAVEHTAREAMQDMRRLLGTIRSGPAPLAPQPGLAQLDALIAETRRAGILVESTVNGPVAALQPGLDLTCYRIVQEALTNVRRHSHATSSSVEVRYGPDMLEIDVCDNGLGAAAGGRPGTGLVGMRERVLLYGGDLTAGPQATGGFRVHARLPVAAS